MLPRAAQRLRFSGGAPPPRFHLVARAVCTGICSETMFGNPVGMTMTFNRDLIDLCVMVRRWCPIPESGWRKAHEAYGATIDRSVAGIADRLRAEGTLQCCLTALDADPAVGSGALECLHAFG